MTEKNVVHFNEDDAEAELRALDAWLLSMERRNWEAQQRRLTALKTVFPDVELMNRYARLRDLYNLMWRRAQVTEDESERRQAVALCLKILETGRKGAVAPHLQKALT